MDQGEAPDYGSGSLVRSVIKAFSGSRFTTQKDSPRESPLFEPLRDAEKAGRINEGEVDGSTDAETKGDVDQMGSRSPVAVSTGEIRQERRLTFREGMEQGVPRSTSEEQQNLQYNHSEQEITFKRNTFSFWTTWWGSFDVPFSSVSFTLAEGCGGCGGESELRRSF